MRTVQFAFDRTSHQSLSAARMRKRPLAANNQATLHGAKLSFGSAQGNAGTFHFGSAASSAANLGLSHNILPAGLMIAGAAVGIAALTGMLLLLPIGLLLAAAGGALLLNKQRNDPSETPVSTGASEIQTVSQTSCPIPSPLSSASSNPDHGLRAPVIMLSLNDDQAEGQTKTDTPIRTSLSPVDEFESFEGVENASTLATREAASSIPGGISLSHPMQAGFGSGVFDREFEAQPSQLDAPASLTEKLNTHADWQKQPLKLNAHSVGYPSGRFTQIFSSFNDINDELGLPAENRNFAGLTLQQVRFNNIAFPPNSDFRNLKVKKGVEFENCKLPGACFDGIEGDGKITFINSDVSDTIFDSSNAHFAISNSVEPPARGIINRATI